MRCLVHWLLRRYARATAAAVRPFIAGDRVLDLGAGEGYVSAALRRAFPGWVCAADIGGFGRTGGPYVTYDGTRLPFADGAVDTTLLLLTLHHCAEPDAVVGEAVRVTRHRLIVTESVYRNRLDRFWLDLLDGHFNRHRHGGSMPPARHFKSPEAWTALFQKHHLRVAHHRWLGSRWERLLHHPLLFVLDKPGTPTHPTAGTVGLGDSCETRFQATIQPSRTDGEPSSHQRRRPRGLTGVPEPHGPGGGVAGTLSLSSSQRTG